MHTIRLANASFAASIMRITNEHSVIVNEIIKSVAGMDDLQSICS